MPTEKQRAAQARFARAAKEARREGKKGKAFSKRVGELLRGRASHGGGHKTKASTSHASHGGGSTAEKSKPKPRIALYGGVIVGASRIGTQYTNLGTVVTNPNNRASSLRYALDSAAKNPSDNIARAGPPALVGALISWGADKVGLNKMLAKARFPLRV